MRKKILLFILFCLFITSFFYLGQYVAKKYMVSKRICYILYQNQLAEDIIYQSIKKHNINNALTFLKTLIYYNKLEHDKTISARVFYSLTVKQALLTYKCPSKWFVNTQKDEFLKIIQNKLTTDNLKWPVEIPKKIPAEEVYFACASSLQQDSKNGQKQENVK